MTIVLEELHRPGGGPSSGQATVRLIASTTDPSAPGYGSGDITILGRWRERAVDGLVTFDLVPTSLIVPAGTVYEIVSEVPGTTVSPRYFTVPVAGPVYVEDVLTELPGSLPTPPLATETAARIAADDLLDGRLDAIGTRNAPSGYAGLDAQATLPDIVLPASIARDSEVTSRVDVEEAARIAGDLDAAAQLAALSYVRFLQAAMNPDLLIVGAITRDPNGAATSAPVVWPDGAPGTYTATAVSAAFPGAVDAYTITYGSPMTKTYTQPAVTRNVDGAVTARPAMSVV